MVSRVAVPDLAGAGAERMAAVEQPHAAIAITSNSRHAQTYSLATSVHRVNRRGWNLAFRLFDITPRYHAHLYAPAQIEWYSRLAGPFRTKILSPIYIGLFVSNPDTILLIDRDARACLKSR